MAPCKQSLASLIGPMLLLISLALACDDTSGDDPCADQPVSPTLTRLFFWGGSDPGNWEPNQEPVRGSGDFVQWLADDRLIMVSRVRMNGSIVRGIVDIRLDVAGAIASTAFHPFDHSVFDMKVGNTSTIYALFYERADSEFPRVGILDISGSEVLVDSVVLDESWRTRGIAPHPKTRSLLACVTRPGASDPALLHFYESGSAMQDSLVWPLFYETVTATRAMDMSDTGVFFWTSHFVGVRSLILRYDFTVKGVYPLVIYDGPTQIDYLAVDPKDDERVLFHGHLYNPEFQAIGEDVVQLVDGRTFVSTPIDIRTATSECRVIRNSFAEWMPDGAAFVFPSWSSDGKSDFPSAIWLKHM